MEINKPCYSPSLRNIKMRSTPSPKELKEKLRKDYKMKVQSCRAALINKFRVSGTENDIHKTLSEIFFNTYYYSEDKLNWQEELQLLDEIKKELIQEELDWWHQEYEKTQLDDMNWDLLNEESVICPICERNNLVLKEGYLKCLVCKLSIYTQKSLDEIKSVIFNCIERHSACSIDVQFTLLPELDQTHIYLICEGCNDMHLVI